MEFFSGENAQHSDVVFGHLSQLSQQYGQAKTPSIWEDDTSSDKCLLFQKKKNKNKTDFKGYGQAIINIYLLVTFSTRRSHSKRWLFLTEK